MRKLRIETQQETLWKSVENQDDLHAAEMVQRLKPHRFCRHALINGTSELVPFPISFASYLDGHGCLVFLVGSFEVGDLVIALEVPDAGGDFVDEIVIVADEEDCTLIALQ